MRFPITRRWVRIVAVAAAALTVLAGALALLDRPTRYSASASVLIAPPATDASLAVTGSDTLSRGTIIATYSEAYASGRVVKQAFAQAGLAAYDPSQVTIATRVLAGTSIIRITATSASAASSESAADAVASYAPQLAGYSVAFTPSVIQGAAGTASVAGPGTTLLAAMLAGISVLAGLVTYSGLSRMLRPPGGTAPTADGHARADGVPNRPAPLADAPPNPAR